MICAGVEITFVGKGGAYFDNVTQGMVLAGAEKARCFLLLCGLCLSGAGADASSVLSGEASDGSAVGISLFS